MHAISVVFPEDLGFGTVTRRPGVWKPLRTATDTLLSLCSTPASGQHAPVNLP
jgi:hypothetical protein